MTTIAANRSEMVCDSRASDGYSAWSLITKIDELNGSLIGYAGTIDACLAAIEWLKCGRRGVPPVFSDDDVISLLQLDAEGLSLYDRRLVPMRIAEPSFAIGTGAQAARVAMLLGLTPSDAVEMASKVDAYTAPPITRRTLSSVSRKRRTKRSG